MGFVCLMYDTGVLYSGGIVCYCHKACTNVLHMWYIVWSVSWHTYDTRVMCLFG